jgi:serine protease Do
MERVVVRHLRGSKANKIEQFPVDTVKELLIGREQAAAIAFDPDQDDLVSRRHAVIRIHKRDPFSFTIADLQSSNGTFLNGERLERESELLVEDRIQLGSGGPEFVFDVEPRPPGMMARTRVFDAGDAPSHARYSDTRVPPEAAASAPREKVGVGRDTIERMFVAERKSAGRKWMYVAAAAILGIAVVGGWSYRRIQTGEAERLADQRRMEEENRQREEALKAKYGLMTPAEIAAAYAGATVFIEAGWKLYERSTGLPIFQKVVVKDNQSYLAFVKLKDENVVPWLVTSEGRDQDYISIGEPGLRGSGFVVTNDGFILTNRHVATNWMSKWDASDKKGMLFFQDQVVWKKEIIDYPWKELEWVPARGYLFKTKTPTLLYAKEVEFEGKNHQLDVTFPKQKLRIPARVVRTSDEHDVALIKIDVPRPLPKVDLAPGDTVNPGDAITILGYPAVSEDAYVAFKQEDWLNSRTRIELVPEPSVTSTYVGKSQGKTKSQLDNTGEGQAQRGTTEQEQIRFAGTILKSKYYELSSGATLAGNSGGPIFNTSGEVIGIFSAARTWGNSSVAIAVPISFGRDLLENKPVLN